MSPPLFRADHIGSLIRPQYLLDAQQGVGQVFAMHNSDKSAYASDLVKAGQDAEKKAMTEAIAQQAKRGIEPITSGEFMRSSFVSGFFENLEGIEIKFMPREEFRTKHPIMKPYVARNIPGRDQPIAVGKIKWKNSAYLEEWQFVKSQLPKELWSKVKITIPSPSWSHTQLQDGRAFTPDAYTNDDDYLRDIGEAVRQEILALYEAGVRFIQIDDPMLAMLVDDEYIDAQKEEGMSFDALLEPSILAHNAAIRDLPSDLTVAMHLCRGNIPKGEKAAVGGYDRMAIRMFKELNYKRFALEYDNSEMTGTLHPLKYLPKNKVVVLGLVTTKDSELEDVKDLEKQVREAAGIIAKAQSRSADEVLRDNLAVSPSCGFMSVSPLIGTGMNEEIQWQKLELVKQLAENIWGKA